MDSVNKTTASKYSAIAAALLMTACGGGPAAIPTAAPTSVATSPPAPAAIPEPTAVPVGGFIQPPGTVAVNFTVDDPVNQVYQAGDLQWKGAMTYDPATRMITPDSTWGGPW